ncbi:nSTAND1 domain-containing NTPase [Actinomadura montaniterrae]|uniref:Novel STAND NTPase 1 domain-containing protein n=1 Tax=Actinomadura montaniterrae TaxID=1803903 RepID=A0A6L3VYA9_9ACTN|nr:hypothetical protein [Actinomadura montaniterrae]KAB2386201.1 hypothetical protein F9B16_07665 [Actinomadura montaniterrae]
MGSSFFTAEERPFFHGRDQEIERLGDLWRSSGLTILHGAAGVGKSSLLHAGLVPSLADKHADVLPVGHPGISTHFPLAAVPRQNLFSFAVLSSWQPHASPYRSSELSVGDFLRRRGGSPLLVAIDQAEAIFRESPVRERDRRRFLEELSAAMRENPGVRLLLCVRDEVLGEAAEFGLRIARTQSTFRLGPLTPENAVEAVRRSLLTAGRTPDPGAVETLVDEIGKDARGEPSGQVEPVLLQAARAGLPPFAMPAPADLTEAVDAALRAHVGTQLAEAAADHGFSVTELTAWFRRAFDDPPPAAEDGLLRTLENRHLIRRRSPRSFEPLHPRLLRPVQSLPEPVNAPAASPERMLAAAREALRGGDLALARRRAEEAVDANDPRHVLVRAEAERTLGDIAHEEFLTDLAIHHYREAAALFESLQDTTAVGHLLAAIGRLLLATADASPATAVEELRAATGRVPNDPGLQAGLGQALFRAGRPQTALAVLSGALTLDGDTPEALQTRGEIFADQGSRESAKSALRDLDRVGRRARPSSEAARALALATLSRLDAAKHALDLALAEADDDGPALLRAARAERLCGDRGAAVKLAALAAEAKDPPLPAHQRDEARLLREMP